MKKYIFLAIVILILFISISIYAENIKIFEGHRSPISDFTLIDNTNQIISIDPEGKIKIWDLNKNKVIKEYYIPNAPYFLSIDISFSQRFIALSGNDIIWIYDIAKKKVIKKIDGVESKGLFTSPDDTMLYLNEFGKPITNGRLAGLLDCSIRTIQRHMCADLKQEKETLNEEV